MNITDLPDFPAIRQIQGALWRTGETRGAAVMVGAGVSRSAELAADNSRVPPLWSDFTQVMEKQLYPSGGAPSDPLRLAEEYRAALGAPALEGLIFDLVRDTEWLPGLLHRKLLCLPWSDVLTTNWDTLLERAAAINTSQTYDTVRSVADIPRTRAPRIVKLHGSMPSNRPFIFTEEDYRAYPTTFAPLVNLTQQVLLENELCLIGFSGDDPNFLKWSGWVRDQLGAATRRIHLIGVLNISPARRKYFEARNVSPVDLAPLVVGVDHHDKHRSALEQFLDFLIKSKPRPAYEWPIERDKDVRAWAEKSIEARRDPLEGAHYLKLMLNVWRKERDSYPGWVVCPSFERHKIRRGTDLGIDFKSVLDRLEGIERGKIIYEIAWRFETAFWPLPTWLVDVFARAIDGGKIEGLDQQQHFFLLLVLLKNARENHDQPTFDQRLTALSAVDDRDAQAATKYEQCLWARDHLDFSKLAQLVDSVQGKDPAWKIRRAALRCELGDMDGAEGDIGDALSEIRDRQSRDRNSIWVISRLAWAMLLAQSIRRPSSQTNKSSDSFAEPDRWPSVFGEMKCDPWDELHALDRGLDEAARAAAKDAITKEPKFDPGTYVDHSHGLRFTSWTVVSPADEVVKLTDWIGLPAVMDHVDIMGTRLRRAADSHFGRDLSGLLACIRVIHSHTDTLIEKRFGRIDVARMPYDTAASLSDYLWVSIEFGSHRLKQLDRDGKESFNLFWIQRVRAHLEILSRIIVRLTDTKANEAFVRAVTFAKTWGTSHWWLFESLGHLLERSLTTISPGNRKNLALDVIKFPLPDETHIGGRDEDWPELIEIIGKSSIVRAPSEADFHVRILELIEKLHSPDPLSRGRAALRLTCIYEAGAMNNVEAIEFGNALWSRRHSTTEFPAETNLLPHVFLIVPAPDTKLANDLFRIKVVIPLANNQISREALAALREASHRDMGPRAFKITPDEAKAILESTLAWRPQAPDDDIGESQFRNRRISRSIGAVLANSVLPALDTNSISNEQIEKLFEMVANGIAPSVVLSLPEISRLDASKSPKVVQLIHRGLLSSDDDTAVFSIHAVHHWISASKEGTLQPCPRELISAAIAMVATRKEAGLLQALYLSTSLVSDRNISDDDQSRLIDALSALRQETAYEFWRAENPRTPTMTLVRAQCVRLANSFRKVGIAHPTILGWIEDAKIDPMPEVRNALEEIQQLT